MGEARRAEVRVALAAVAVAALSALVVAPAPSYDPWAWLLWGREVVGLDLSTAEGPAFKPLPVALCALLTPLGGLAPEAWVIVARTGAVLAVLLAFRLGRRVTAAALANESGGAAASTAVGRSDLVRSGRAGAPVVGLIAAAGAASSTAAGSSDLVRSGRPAAPFVAGLVAAAGVALCGAFLGYAASGAETGWTIALGLMAAEAWRTGRMRAALACGVGCALLRVEAWPFLLVAGLVLWRRRPADRWLLVACAVAVPALWLVPEWLGSGDILRSSARARVPNPGQPALADLPAWASFREALALPLWPLWAGALAALAIPAARAVLAAGFAWIGVVAVMAQAGFSGEPRYALPGAALVSIAGAAGLVTLVRAAGPANFGLVRRWARVARRADGAAIRGVARISSRGPKKSWPPPRTAPLNARRSPAPASGLWSGIPAPGRHAAAALATAALLIAAAPRLADLPDLRRSQAWQRGLASDLERAITAAGGREAVLACGRPYVGDLRGPLLAYHLNVEKRLVAFEPEPPGTVFRSRLNAGGPVEPPTAPAFAPRARAGRWQVLAAC